MAKPLIRVSNLAKRYPDGNEAVKGFSFEVAPKQILGILGPNGAGKTTTLEMMEGLTTITGGEVVIDGVSVKGNEQRIKSMIGVQPQNSAFLDEVRLSELLDSFAAMYGGRANPLDLLAKVGLQDKAKSYPEQLSGGQRQRFSIAVALVHQPKVLFLDEPTTGLDPQARRNLWDLIEQIRRDGVTIILTTHYMEEAEVLCDQICIMDGGKIIATGTPDRLIAGLIERGFKPHKAVQAASLEDVFIDLTGRELRD